jgi:hypothetical protein
MMLIDMNWTDFNLIQSHLILNLSPELGYEIDPNLDAIMNNHVASDIDIEIEIDIDSDSDIDIDIYEWFDICIHICIQRDLTFWIDMEI